MTTTYTPGMDPAALPEQFAARFRADPTSKPSQILRYFAEHRGLHRCSEVAAALEMDTHLVAVFARRFANQELIERHEVPVQGWKKKVTLYGLSDKDDPNWDATTLVVPAGGESK